jgi:hypothetical protein
MFGKNNNTEERKSEYRNASITESKDKINIVGDSENLRALGEALVLKSKMGKNMSCVITDGHNRPIEITHIDDIMDSDGNPIV